MTDVHWHCCTFSELTVDQLFDIFKLRQTVFVLEQNCLYPDIDDTDKKCHHLLGYIKEQLVAYLRIIPPAANDSNISIGRVVIAGSVRKLGLGRILMQNGINYL